MIGRRRTLRSTGSLLALLCAGTILAPTARAADATVFADLKAPAGLALRPVGDATPMHVVLSLPLRDAAGAQAYADAVSNPRNALYGKYLTPAEFGTRFGGDAATYDFVRNWAAKLGFSLSQPTASHTIIVLGGSAHQFASLFATKFASFQTASHGDGQEMLVAPRLPNALAGRINGVVGLAWAQHFATLIKMPGSHALVGNGKGGGYDPSDMKLAYSIPAQISATASEHVALFEQGGYNTSYLTTYETQYSLPAVPVSQVGVNGVSTQQRFGVLPEDMLDLDVLVGLDPKLAAIKMYVDGTDAFPTALTDALDEIANNDTETVVSISYGQAESAQGSTAIAAENTALLQMKAQGQTVFASAGDDGADNLNTFDPGSQPNLTGAGGTTLNVNATTGAWTSETAWVDSGGGISSVWSIPSYQLKNGVSVATANGGSATMRNEPDIGADADPNTGYNIYCPGLDCEEIGWGAVGGTSLSAPIWAAMISIANADEVAAKKPRLGFLNPTIYAMLPTSPATHDITVGNNGSPGYTAGKGYDNITGIGSINLGTLLPAPK